MNQVNLDRAVSDLLDTVRNVYRWLLREDTISILDRAALAMIAEAVSNSAHFVINYSTSKNFWIRTGKNILSEMHAAIDNHMKTLESLMQQCRDRTVPQHLGQHSSYTGRAELRRHSLCRWSRSKYGEDMPRRHEDRDFAGIHELD